jgi:two-component system, NtrC family, sensor kinase
MKIAHKMMTSFFLTAIVCSVLGSVIVFYVEKDNLKTMVDEHLSTTVQSRGDHIETVIEGYKDKISVLAEKKVFINAVDTTRGSAQEIEEANREIKTTLKTHTDIVSISVMNKDGIIAASSGKNIGDDKSNDEVFLKGKDGAYAEDIHFSRRTGSDGVRIASPIFIAGKVVGVVDSTFSAQEIQGIIANKMGLGETGEMYLENSKGLMMLASQVRRKKNRSKFLRAKDIIQPMEWVLVAEISQIAALTPLLRKLQPLLVFVIISITILTTAIGKFISVPVIAGPLVKLRKGIEIIGSGNMDYKVRTEAKDEIGQLSRAFDKMINDLKKVVVSKNYVDNIVNNMADMLIVIKPDGNIEKVNKAALDNLGYDEEDLIGKHVRVLFQEEGIALKGAKFEKLMKGATVKDYETELKSKDGKKIPVILSGSAIRATSCSHVGLSEDCPTFQEKGRHCKSILRIVCVAKDIPGERETITPTPKILTN